MPPPGFSSRRVAVAGAPVGPSSYSLPIFPDGLRTNDGGPTPWGTWLSGEEVEAGLIWECDPAGKIAAEARPALGAFNHEAAAVDRVGERLYLSEDHPEGGFYRFTPTTYPDLLAGTLEIAQRADDGSVVRHVVPDPTTAHTATGTRHQVAQMTKFNGGKGLRYAAGDVFACEDGGNLEVGLITPEKQVSPMLRFTGPEHADSELCGVVFDPSGTRMYVTSQRAEIRPGAKDGAVYEITGPFRIPAGGVPADQVYGPPIGEPAPAPPSEPAPPALPDTSRPALAVRVDRSLRRKGLLSSGTLVRITVDEPAAVAVVFDSKALKRSRARRPVNVVLARGRRQHPGASRQIRIRLRLTRSARKALRRTDGAVRARILVTARDAAGNESTVVRSVRIGRAK